MRRQLQIVLVLLGSTSVFFPPREPRAGGMGISTPPDLPDTMSVGPSTSLDFHRYVVPFAVSPLANRDIEFLWSDTYAQLGAPLVLPGGQENDLDRFGAMLCTEKQNTFNFNMTDIQLVHDYLNVRLAFRDSVYSTLQTDPGFQIANENDPPTERQHVDTYLWLLTDPTLFSGIGNAYSDEILHRARLSPFARAGGLDAEAVARLRDATRAVLTEWTDRLRAATAGKFPREVTAFRDGMAVHGRYGQPCPDCGAPIQRVVYVEREMNYCARCQTGGRVLADRSLSRLLHDDWPRRIEELEGR